MGIFLLAIESNFTKNRITLELKGPDTRKLVRISIEEFNKDLNVMVKQNIDLTKWLPWVTKVGNPWSTLKK